jgi:hypothetical protein
MESRCYAIHMAKPLFIACLPGALLLLSWAVASGQVYRWVDEDGVVHYSDQPHPGAEEIELESAPTISMPQPRSTVRRRAGPEDEDTGADAYESLAVAQPAAEETLWNIEGVLNVALNLQPALQPGHQVRVYFDGTPQMVSGTQFQLEEVYRGEHNLQAEVLDENGNLLIRSEPIRFYVQQTSILNPQRR